MYKENLQIEISLIIVLNNTNSFNIEATVKLLVHYQTTNLFNFTNTKDRKTSLSQTSVCYKYIAQDAIHVMLV